MSTSVEQQTANPFDVFVSYSELDESWVLAELCPRLEAAAVRIIHRGDFSPGVPLVDELERAIRDCSWTLLVFTPSYLQDHWTSYEEKLAANAVLQTGERRVIPVVKGPCELPLRLNGIVPVDLSCDDWRQWNRLVDRIRGLEWAEDGPIMIKEAMKRLKAQPAVRDMMVRFETDFHAAGEQIDVLANYKHLHDLLHNLDLSCYSPILREVRRFPDDELGRQTLGEYAWRLQNYVDRIRLVTCRPTFQTEDFHWVDDLSQAHDDLRGALASRDARQLKRAVAGMRRVLDLQPSQINTRMNQTAGALRLPDLVASLRTICERLSGMHVAPDDLARFGAQVDDVSAMSDELSTLRTDHDRWQDLDCALRRIEDVLRLDVEELQNSWPYLKKIAEPLCSNTAEEWAQRFRESMRTLECAMGEGEEAEVWQPFRSYRAQATFRFFSVDESMKDLCDRLRKVGQPIEHALGIST